MRLPMETMQVVPLCYSPNKRMTVIVCSVIENKGLLQRLWITQMHLVQYDLVRRQLTDLNHPKCVFKLHHHLSQNLHNLQ